VKNTVCPTLTVDRDEVTDGVSRAGETVSVRGVELALAPFESRMWSATANVPAALGEQENVSESAAWQPEGIPDQLYVFPPDPPVTFAETLTS